MDRLLTIHQAAEALKLKVSTLYRFSCQRKIETVKIGGALRFKESSLQKYINDHTKAPVKAET